MTRKMQVILGIVAVLALLVGWQWRSHSGEEANSAIRTERSAAEPVAAVVRAEQRSLGIPLALAGAFQTISRRGCARKGGRLYPDHLCGCRFARERGDKCWRFWKSLNLLRN